MDAKILKFERPEGVEIINGTTRHLGRMSLEELNELEADANHRVQEAQLDAWVIADIRERRFGGDEPGSAA